MFYNKPIQYIVFSPAKTASLRGGTERPPCVKGAVAERRLRDWFVNFANNPSASLTLGTSLCTREALHNQSSFVGAGVPDRPFAESRLYNWDILLARIRKEPAANATGSFWLGWQESNLHGQSQSLLSYH